MFYEIKVLELNATKIKANLIKNYFRIKKINAKE